MADLADITDRLRAGNAWLPGKRVKFDFRGEGVILLDGVANAVSNDDAPADTTIRLSLDNFRKLAKGELNATTAFMMGKLKIDGDMALALQLQQVLGALRG